MGGFTTICFKSGLADYTDWSSPEQREQTGDALPCLARLWSFCNSVSKQSLQPVMKLPLVTQLENKSGVIQLKKHEYDSNHQLLRGSSTAQAIYYQNLFSAQSLYNYYISCNWETERC